MLASKGAFLALASLAVLGLTSGLPTSPTPFVSPAPSSPSPYSPDPTPPVYSPPHPTPPAYSPIPPKSPYPATSPLPLNSPFVTSPIPTPSNSPPLVQATSLCSWQQYDGSLGSCGLFFDANGNGQLDPSEAQTVIVDGSFALPALASEESLGPAYILPARSGDFRRVVPGTSAPCHDSATGVTVTLPLAAPRPASCTAKLSLSPVSSILVYGQAVGLTQEELKLALGLPESATIGEHNAYKAALLGEAGSNEFLTAELSSFTTTQLYSLLYAKDPTAFSQVARAFFAALASAAKNSADTGAGRRRLLSAGTLDLTSAAALQELAAAAVLAAQQQVSQGALYNPDPAVLSVVSNSIAALNSVLASAPSAFEVQHAVVDATLELTGRIQALVNGSLSLDQFLHREVVVKSDIPAPAAPAPSNGNALASDEGVGSSSGSNAGAVAGGVVGGVVGMAIILGVAVYIKRRSSGRLGGHTWTNVAASDPHDRLMD